MWTALVETLLTPRPVFVTILMRMTRTIFVLSLSLSAAAMCSVRGWEPPLTSLGPGGKIDPDGIEFFEKNIQPILAEQYKAPAQGRPPGPRYGRRPAGQRQLLQMGDPTVAEQVADEDLASPQPPVVAVPEAVHADAADGTAATVRAHPRSAWRVMMV